MRSIDRVLAIIIVDVIVYSTESDVKLICTYLWNAHVGET